MPHQSTCQLCGREFVWENHFGRDREHRRVYCSIACRVAGDRNTPEHFWNRFDKAGPVPAHRPDLGPCWIWTGSLHGHGYGNVGWYGRLASTHRVAWELTNGAIPDGLHVLHLCDNPPCGNPQHLWLGNHSDNMRDRERKGRVARRGAANPFAKLTDEDVREIRRRAPSMPRRQRQLAREFGVSYSTLRRIVTGERWAHVAFAADLERATEEYSQRLGKEA